MRAGGPGTGTTFLLSLPLGVSADSRRRDQTVERRVTCSPVVFDDIKHLAATCDRRARFRHPVTARGSSHALLPWALPRERATPHICNDVNGLTPDGRRVHRTQARARPTRPAFPAFLAGAGRPLLPSMIDYSVFSRLAAARGSIISGPVSRSATAFNFCI